MAKNTADSAAIGLFLNQISLPFNRKHKTSGFHSFLQHFLKIFLTLERMNVLIAKLITIIIIINITEYGKEARLVFDITKLTHWHLFHYFMVLKDLFSIKMTLKSEPYIIRINDRDFHVP